MQNKMKVHALSWLVLITTLVSTVVAEEKHVNQDNPSLRPGRRNKECPDGFGGINCKDNVDECKGTTISVCGWDTTRLILCRL
jgi:hypothetical protein